MNGGNMQVAETILSQLGGRQFIVMTGSKNFGGTENSLSFKLSRNKAGATHARIVLTPMDEYDFELLAIRGTSVKTVKKLEGIYFDQLRSTFEEVTGLYTSL
jgi:hypothetical protein